MPVILVTPCSATGSSSNGIGTGMKHTTDCNADETAAGEPCTGIKTANWVLGEWGVVAQACSDKDCLQQQV